MLFYCQEVFRKRSPAAAVKAAAAVQQLAASHQKGRSGLEKRRFWHRFVLHGHAVLLPGGVSQAFASSSSKCSGSSAAASSQLAAFNSS